jgi:HEAT repeat protein
MVDSTQNRRLGRARPALLAGLVLIAALATAVFLSRSGSPSLDAETESPARDDTDTPAPGASLPLEEPAASEGESPPTRVAEPGETRPQSAVTSRFTVAISPLALATTDRAAALSFRSIYASLLDELRAIPNLDLVVLESAAAKIEPEAVDFELRVTGESRGGPGAGPLFRVRWAATRGGNGRWDASTDSASAWTAQTVAHAAAESLRLFPFPPDVARPVVLEGIVLDPDRDSRERFAAIEELKTIPQRFAFEGRDERRVVAVAAADIVANSTDPEVRGRVWLAMRKLDDPYLVEPLADSLLHDDSDYVRLEAVKTLGSAFGRDAKAVAALEYALVHDVSPQVRANARWESLDEAGRRDYVAGTLLRDDLSDAARLELLTADVRSFNSYIDRRAAQALIDISSRARPSEQEPSPEDPPGRVSAAEVVPALIDLLTEDADAEIRAAAATALIRHRGEPGVRDELQRAGRDDASPQVRSHIAFLFRRYGVAVPLKP